MKKGFTMIELIFVIVILGILAAVAIPKLAATRDDANVAKAATNIATAINDIGAFYTARGSFAALSEMTSVQLSDSSTKFNYNKDKNMTGKSNKVYFTDTSDTSSAVGCIGFFVSAADGNLTISTESNTTSTCKGINGAIKRLVKVHSFGGSSVKW